MASSYLSRSHLDTLDNRSSRSPPLQRYHLEQSVNSDDLFIIPRAPELSKVSEPKPFLKVTPGYDMRTLRKQIDAMHSDITERCESQAILYKQNEQLWSYLQALLRSNKKNALALSSHVNQLNAELNQLHIDKVLLAEKLTIAQSAQKDLNELSEEHTQVESSLLYAESKRQEALSALESARSQNMNLESSLSGQIERLQSVHAQLEDLRHLKHSEESISRADIHFSTSYTTLKNAFQRFRKCIHRCQRCSKFRVGSALLYRYFLKRMVWRMWSEYSHRVKIQKRNVHNRNKRLLLLLLTQWKVFTALEKRFRITSQYHMKQHIFNQWKSHHRDAQKEKWLQQKLEIFQRHKIKKKCFDQWKKDCIFLSCYDYTSFNSNTYNGMSSITQYYHGLEKTAVRHYLSTIFQKWRRIASELQYDLSLRAEHVQQMRVISLRQPLLCWYTYCKAIWHYCRYMCLRVYTKLQYKIQLFHKYRKAKRYALLTNTKMRQKRVFSKLRYKIQWKKYLRQIISTNDLLFVGTNLSTHVFGKITSLPLSSHVSHASIRRSGQGNGHEVSKSMRYVTQRKRQKIVYNSLLIWVFRVAKYKRLKLADLHANKFYAMYRNKQALKMWYFNTCQVKRLKAEYKYNLLKTSFVSWLQYTPHVRREKYIEKMIAHRLAKRSYELQDATFLRWKRFAKTTRHLKKVELKLLLSQKRNILRTFFVTWRSQWGTKLFWSEKEAKIDAKRNILLVNLKEKELHDCLVERDNLQYTLLDTSDAMNRMREAISLKNEDINTHQMLYQEKVNEQEILQRKLREYELALRDCQDERDRLRVLEEMYTQEREKEVKKMKVMQSEAEETLRKLEIETSSLRDEVNEVRGQSFALNSFQESKLHQDELDIDNVVNSAKTLQAIVNEKKRELTVLELERDSFTNQISQVKTSLHSLANNSSLPADGSVSEDGVMRRRSSEVHNLRLSTIEAEARVEALRGIMKDRRDNVLLGRQNDLLREERWEERELSGILHGGDVEEDATGSRLVRDNDGDGDGDGTGRSVGKSGKGFVSGYSYERDRETGKDVTSLHYNRAYQREHFNSNHPATTAISEGHSYEDNGYGMDDIDVLSVHELREGDGDGSKSTTDEYTSDLPLQHPQHQREHYDPNKAHHLHHRDSFLDTTYKISAVPSSSVSPHHSLQSGVLTSTPSFSRYHPHTGIPSSSSSSVILNGSQSYLDNSALSKSVHRSMPTSRSIYEPSHRHEAQNTYTRQQANVEKSNTADTADENIAGRLSGHKINSGMSRVRENIYVEKLPSDSHKHQKGKDDRVVYTRSRQADGAMHHQASTTPSGDRYSQPRFGMDRLRENSGGRSGSASSTAAQPPRPQEEYDLSVESSDELNMRIRSVGDRIRGKVQGYGQGQERGHEYEYGQEHGLSRGQKK